VSTGKITDHGWMDDVGDNEEVFLKFFRDGTGNIGVLYNKFIVDKLRSKDGAYIQEDLLKFLRVTCERIRRVQ